MQFFKDLNPAAITGLLTAFPKELVAAIAGLALLGTIGGGLAAGAIALFAQQYGQQRRAPLPGPLADSPTTFKP